MQVVFKWGLDDEQEIVKWHPALEIISSESVTLHMGEYSWFPRLIRHVRMFRNSYRMLRLGVGTV